MKSKVEIDLVYGMMCEKWVWENFITWCNENYSEVKINALELPYHGEITEKEKTLLGNLQITDYVDYLLAQKEDKGTSSSKYTQKIGIGHSMGGLLVALVEASRSSVVYDRLILLSPAHQWGIVTMENSVIKTFWSALSTPKIWNRPFKLTYEEISSGMLNMIPDNQKRITIYNKLGYESGRAAFQIALWWLDSLFNLRKASNLKYQNMTCPVLIITGEKDKTVPVKAVEKVFKKIKSELSHPVIMKTFPDTGHWIPDEDESEKVFESIFEWINQG